jgi:hypothetical protein
MGAQRAEDLMGTLAEELIGTLSEEYFERGRQKGRAEGRAVAVLDLLVERGVNVDDKACQRILSCTDLDTLDLWFKRAIKATHISQVLDGLPQ